MSRLKFAVPNLASCFVGKWEDLLVLVAKAYKDYSVHDARRNARHCRDTMRAYLAIGNKEDLCLSEVTAIEKKYKSHRRVFDSVTHEIMLVADMPRTAQQIKIAARTAKTRIQKDERADWMRIAKAEIGSRFARRDRENRTEEKRIYDNEAAKSRRAVLVTKQYLSKAKAIRMWKYNSK